MSFPELAPEEQARANFYALLARLLHSPPDRALLGSLAGAGEIAAQSGEAPLAAAWRDLVKFAATADPQAVREEYEAAFIGTGKADVTLYMSAYLDRDATHNTLLDVRAFLAEHGLRRKDAVHEPEDHVAALCEVMRHLIVTGDAAAQRECFQAFLGPGTDALCDAIIGCERAAFYRAVASFGKLFFALEHSAFDMD